MLLFSVCAFIMGMAANAADVTVKVTKSDGSPFSGVSIKYSNGSVHSFGTTDANGIATRTITDGSYTFQAIANSTSKTSSSISVSGSSDTVNFQTNLLTLKLKNCDDEGISGGHVRYGLGANSTSYHFPGGNTDVNGETSMQAFPSTFSFEMEVNSTKQVKSNVVFTGSESWTWTPTNVKFNYPNTISYGGIGDSRWFTNAGMYMFPGTYNFDFRASSALSVQNYEEITIPDSTCSIEKTPVIIHLVSSTNDPLSGADVSYYLGGWKSGFSTKANGNAVLLLEGNQTKVTSAVRYKGTREQKNHVQIPSNAVITYQTILVTMNLKDPQGGNSLEGTGLSYYAAGWRTFGSGVTTSGSETMELLHGKYSFAMHLNGSRTQGVYNISANDQVDFNASAVTVNVVNQNSAPLGGANTSYYAAGWHGIGATDNLGNSPVTYLLNGSHSLSFAAKLGSNRVQIGHVNISSANQTVAIVLQESSAMNQHIDMSDLINPTKVVVYPNPATDFINIQLPTDQGSIAIYSIDGRQVIHQEVESSSTRISLTNLPSGTYIAVMKFDGKSETVKFIKQ